MKKGCKKKYIIILFIIVILILTPIIIFTTKYIYTKNKPLISNDETINISINKGDSLYGVLEKLSNEGVLRSSFFSKAYLKLNKTSMEIKPGEYVLNKSITLPQLISTLEQGLTITNNITFPEGYNIDDIAKKLEENGMVKKDDFLNEVKKYPLPSYVKQDSNKRYQLEGYLFPDTYSFNKGVTSQEIISTMLQRFEQVMKEVEKETKTKINLNEYEKYVNIASMIEKESRVDEDRPLVSSVIYNRIGKGMSLQLDATVLYALGQHKEVVYYKDLEVNSPYNTYKVKGLPVGPIASPGKPSLIAAVKPAQTDYLYYLLAKDNKHYFTNDYNDFLNKKKELGY